MVERKTGRMELPPKMAASFFSTHAASSRFIPRAKNTDSDDSFQSYSSDKEDQNPSVAQNEVAPLDISKNFPPPNPLLPKSSLVLNEPLKIGGNIHFL